ncbi:MAG: hypothetical protein ACM3N4_04260 [Nitrososphaerota archaeon]
MSMRGEKPDREVLNVPERVIEPMVTILIMGLLASFFAYHQIAATGFFTEQFGPFEMLCLYGPIVLSLAAPAVRALTGRRNPGRPLEVVTNVCMVLAALWFLRVFPFDFTHLADALPPALRFMLDWISNGIGRIILVLQVIVGSLVAVFTLLKFISVLGHHHHTHTVSPTPLVS